MALFHTTVLDNQIKALPTVDTASGAIATFNTDLTENLVEVKCQIVAKQASGTPSPDNPLPITTYTEMNVGACGINFANLATRASATVANITSEIQADNHIIASGVSSGNGDIYCYFVNNTHLNGTFTLSLNGTDTRTGTLSVFFHKVSGGYLSAISMAYNKHSIRVTLNDTFDYILLRTSNTQSITLNCKLQIELGNTATEYEPYQGTTANIPFGQTVANGVLDITTGKLKVTHGYYQFDGTETPIAYGSGYRYVVLSGKEGKAYEQYDIPDLLCNMYTATSRINIQGGTTGISLTGDTILLSSDTPNGVQVVYELVTPIEIQLDSITLQALLNENNIWCDTGDTEVKFLLTVGKAIS